MSWANLKISYVADIVSGGTPKSGTAEFWGGDVQWLTPSDMGKMEDVYISETSRKISMLGLSKSSAKLIPPFSVILSTRAPIGHLAINTVAMATNQGCRGLIPKSNINTKYLYYFLLKSVDLLNELGSGTTFKELSKSALEKVEIPVPPLEEQRRLVTILDQTFADIDQARTNAETNLKNARELFDSYLEQVFSQRVEGWTESRLGDLLDIGSSKRIYETDWTKSGVPFFGGKEIVQLAKYGTVVSNAYISEEKYLEYASKYDMPKKGDILMTARGTIGVGYIVQEGDKFYYKDGNIISLRQKTLTNPQFILYAFKTKKILEQIERLTGTTVKHLPLSAAKEIIISIPNYEAQNELVLNVKKMEMYILNLIHIYEKKLLAIDELKKSILYKAFTGELTKSKGVAV